MYLQHKNKFLPKGTVGLVLQCPSVYNKTKSLPDGKSVNVDYRETPKGNRMVEILDESMSSYK